jgi:hypothetical protein
MHAAVEGGSPSMTRPTAALVAAAAKQTLDDDGMKPCDDADHRDAVQYSMFTAIREAKRLAGEIHEALNSHLDYV